MSYGSDIAIPGWRLRWDFGTITPDTIVRETLYVPGKHWAFREAGTLRHWFSPDLEWLAEFRAECEVFERVRGGWHAERDGFEYRIPARWSERTRADYDWFQV